MIQNINVPFKTSNVDNYIENIIRKTFSITFENLNNLIRNLFNKLVFYG